MSDIDKTLLSLPVLAAAVALLFAANNDPTLMKRLFSTEIGSVPPSSTYVPRPAEFDLAPYQRQPHFPDR